MEQINVWEKGEFFDNCWDSIVGKDLTLGIQNILGVLSGYVGIHKRVLLVQHNNIFFYSFFDILSYYPIILSILAFQLPIDLIFVSQYYVIFIHSM